jgi:hypothetical protein
MRFVGQFQHVTRRHRRKEFGVLKMCITNVICDGAYVDSYVELERPSGAWKLGIIPKNTWIQWDSGTINDLPHNMVILEGEQPELQGIADNAVWSKGAGDNVMDVFMKPDPNAILHVEHHESDAIPDIFLKPSK